MRVRDDLVAGGAVSRGTFQPHAHGTVRGRDQRAAVSAVVESRRQLGLCRGTDRGSIAAVVAGSQHEVVVVPTPTPVTPAGRRGLDPRDLVAIGCTPRRRVRSALCRELSDRVARPRDLGRVTGPRRPCRHGNSHRCRRPNAPYQLVPSQSRATPGTPQGGRLARRSATRLSRHGNQSRSGSRLPSAVRCQRREGDVLTDPFGRRH